MYTLDGYGRMIADSDRMTTYIKAMETHITSETVVLDIGTGSGIMACLACRMGAREVVAVEPDPVIHVARRIAAANGFSDRIRFIQAASTEVTLDRPADLVVSDLRGVLPMLGRNMMALSDARERLMTPGGTFIPCRDRIHLALVSAPTLHAEIVDPWNAQYPYIDMVEAHRHVTNMWYRRRLASEHLATPPALAATIDYAAISSPDIQTQVDWTIEDPVTCHGIAAWFDTELIPGVGFSNTPDASPKIYAQAFFPYDAPLSLEKESRVTVEFSADLVGDDYHWRWKTRSVTPEGHGDVMDQSTFQGALFDPMDLTTLASDHRPRLSSHGKMAQWLLSRMDGSRTLTDLARAAAETFPESFASESEAMVMVRHISRFASRLPEAP